MKELCDLLEQTSTYSGKLLLLSDFNVPVDSKSDSESRQLLALFDSFGLLQHVKGSTHIHGHTLDLAPQIRHHKRRGGEAGTNSRGPLSVVLPMKV